MSVKSIMKVNQIVLIATGLEKAHAIKESLEGPVTNLVPASILQTHPNVTVYLDKEAASLLNRD